MAQNLNKTDIFIENDKQIDKNYQNGQLLFQDINQLKRRKQTIDTCIEKPIFNA